MTSLDGLRVVELSRGVAAAYCGKLLADAGAQVVVYEPDGGHPLRRSRPAPPPAREGLLFDFLMESKKVVPAGTDAEGAQLVVADGPADAVGDLAGAWPGAMTVHISPFGGHGPWVGRPASEITVQAFSGSLIRRGLPGRPPVQAGGGITDWVGGAYAAAAAACYWWGRGAGSAGVHLDVSSLESAVLSLHSFMTVDAEFRVGDAPVRRGPAIPSIEPTADGHVGFSTITAQQFRDFLVMIERPDLADDPDLARHERRTARRAELDEAICAWTTVRTTEEIVALATGFRIPVAPIGNGETLPVNEHMVARHVFCAGENGVLAPRVPYRITPGAGAGDAVETLASGDGPAHDRSELALAGLKVADFTAFWAGPSATHLLACLGADVVKIESVQRPDGMRFTSTRPDDDRFWEWGAVFHGVNANKRSVTLDLGDPRGADLARALIRWADVVIENFSPRVMEHFGFGWEQVSAMNPAAVMVRMPAFGLTGPWRDRTGFAMTVEQSSGLAWQTGYEDGPPMDVGGVCDPFGGMHAVVGLMSALSRRDRTGRGALVELPLVEVALNAAAEHVLQFSAGNVLLGRLGNRAVGVAPQGVYRCRGDDGWVAVSVADDAQWRALAEVAGLADLAEAADLARVEGRIGAHDRIDEALAAWCAGLDAAEVEERLSARGIPAAAVVVPARVLDNPHLVARDFFEPVEHPVVGRYRLPSLPITVAGRRRRWNRTPPPTLGQHNAEVLGGLLGVDGATLDELRRDRVIGEAP